MAELNPEQEAIANELEKASALDAVAQSEGGQILVKALLQDIVGCVDALGSQYKTLSQEAFISICADMKTKLDIARSLVRAKPNMDALNEELKAALTRIE